MVVQEEKRALDQRSDHNHSTINEAVVDKLLSDQIVNQHPPGLDTWIPEVEALPNTYCRKES